MLLKCLSRDSHLQFSVAKQKKWIFFGGGVVMTVKRHCTWISGDDNGGDSDDQNAEEDATAPTGLPIATKYNVEGFIRRGCTWILDYVRIYQKWLSRDIHQSTWHQCVVRDSNPGSYNSQPTATKSVDFWI